MGAELHCNFTAPSGKGTVYWWPLLFDVLAHQDFFFSVPPDNKSGHYLYSRNFNEPDDIDYVSGSFRDLWNEIYRGTSSIVATFWSHHDTDEEAIDFMVQVTQEYQRQNDIIPVHFTLSGAYVNNIALEVARKRVQRVFACACAFQDICPSCPGEMYWLWGDEERPVASFGQPFSASLIDGLAFSHKKLVVLKRTTLEGNRVYILDPVPLAIHNGKWVYGSLFPAR